MFLKSLYLRSHQKLLSSQKLPLNLDLVRKSLHLNKLELSKSNNKNKRKNLNVYLEINHLKELTLHKDNSNKDINNKKPQLLSSLKKL